MARLAVNVGLAVGSVAALVLIAIGLAALVEVHEPDWVTLILGLVILAATAVPLAVRARKR